MKKIIVLLLGVMCVGLFGCSSNFKTLFGIVSKRDQKAILEHLEQKYGEKFIIESTFGTTDESSHERGAMVYPEGKEDEAFLVEITPKGSFVDEYVLRAPEKRMQPVYEEWIRSIIPEAKVAIKLSIGIFQKKEVLYNPDETLQQFVDEVKDINVNVDIMLSETMRENQDKIFEKLSKLLKNEPILGYEMSKYAVGFFVQDAFDSIESDGYMYINPHLSRPKLSESYREASRGLVAQTYCFAHWEKKPQVQSEILKELNSNFRVKEGKK